MQVLGLYLRAVNKPNTLETDRINADFKGYI